MLRISKEEYEQALKTQPMKVKKTKTGFYKLGKNKWITNKKEQNKLLRIKYDIE